MKAFVALGLAAALAAAPLPALRAAADSAPPINPEDLKHGAVLCNWGIEIAVKQVGEHCFPGRDPEFQRALDQSIADIDRFILVNAPATPEQLEARRDAGIKELAGQDICRGDPAAMYSAMRDAGPDALRKATADLISVPRKPVMNPCL